MTNDAQARGDAASFEVTAEGPISGIGTTENPASAVNAELKQEAMKLWAEGSIAPYDLYEVAQGNPVEATAGKEPRVKQGDIVSADTAAWVATYLELPDSPHLTVIKAPEKT